MKLSYFMMPLHPLGRSYIDTLREDPRWRAFLERVGSLPEQLNDIDFEVTLPEAIGSI